MRCINYFFLIWPAAVELNRKFALSGDISLSKDFPAKNDTRKQI